MKANGFQAHPKNRKSPTKLGAAPFKRSLACVLWALCGMGLFFVNARAGNVFVTTSGNLTASLPGDSIQITLPAQGTLNAGPGLLRVSGIEVMAASQRVLIEGYDTSVSTPSPPTEIRAGFISAAAGTELAIGKDANFAIRRLEVNKDGKGGTVFLNGGLSDEYNSTGASVAAGTLVLSGGVVVLNTDALGYTGVTEMTRGKLVIANVQGLGVSSGLLLKGGTLTADALTNSLSFGRTLSANVSVAGDVQFGEAGADKLTFSGSVATTGGRRRITVLGTVEIAGNMADSVVSTGTPGAGNATTLVKGGAGTLVLGAANDYTGGTVLQAGSLIASVEQALGGFKFGGSTAGGSLSVEGGHLWLGAPQVVAGLSISGGEISVDSNAFDPVYAGTLTVSGPSATMIEANVARSASISVSVMEALGSGSLGLTKTGTGILTLTGSNGYTGDTVIGAGSIRVTHGDAHGFGPLGKSGAGKVILDGGALFAEAPDADTTIPLGKNIYVMSDSRLISKQGTLWVGSTKVASGGTLHTLGKIRTQAFDLGGRLVLSGSDTLSVVSMRTSGAPGIVWDRNVSGSGGPLGIQVTGNQATDLSGVTVELSPAFVQGAIQQSGQGGVGPSMITVGTLIISSGSLLAPTHLVAPAGSLSFTLSSGTFAGGEYVRIVMNRAQSGNLGNLSPALTSRASTAGMASLQALAVASALDSRLEAISANSAVEAPHLSMGARVLAHEDASQPSMLRVTGGGDSDRDWRVWSTAYGSWSRVAADVGAGYSGVNSSGGGGMLGLERHAGGATGGLVFTAGEARTHLDDNSYRVGSENWNVGGYGSVSIGNIVVDASVLYGVADQDSRRDAGGGTAKAKYTTKEWNLGTGLTLNLTDPSSEWKLAPVVRLKYLSAREGAFEETGTLTPVTSKGQNRDFLLSKVGVHAGHFGKVSSGFVFGVDGSAYWVHDYSNGGRDMEFQLGGLSYVVRGRSGTPDSLQAQLGLSAIISEKLSLKLSGQHDMNANSRQTTGLFSVAVDF